MNTDNFIAEARARIIWGEPSSSVRRFLISNGVPDLVTDAKLKEFEVERSRELRRIGLRNVLIGVVLTGAAGINYHSELTGVDGRWSCSHVPRRFGMIDFKPVHP